MSINEWREQNEPRLLGAPPLGLDRNGQGRLLFYLTPVTLGACNSAPCHPSFVTNTSEEYYRVPRVQDANNTVEVIPAIPQRECARFLVPFAETSADNILHVQLNPNLHGPNKTNTTYICNLLSSVVLQGGSSRSKFSIIAVCSHLCYYKVRSYWCGKCSNMLSGGTNRPHSEKYERRCVGLGKPVLSQVTLTAWLLSFVRNSCFAFELYQESIDGSDAPQPTIPDGDTHSDNGLLLSTPPSCCIMLCLLGERRREKTWGVFPTSLGGGLNLPAT